MEGQGGPTLRVVALIPAAGQGKRMGSERPKAFILLGGLPILAHTPKNSKPALR
ncbi:MAG: 2-C-methyl-D-erythritol 4-phosphate cytidylyltransferase [Syntrophaceae bacterium]|nr:2-C-methyl-D-erythritol 4-phosphate cytidylyltransferase [Syntrophaceae bacterium]